MSTGWIVIIIGSFAAAVDLLLARHYMNVTPEDLARKPDPRGRTAEQFQLAGKMLAGVGVAIFLIAAAIAFGLIPTGLDPARF